MGYAGSNPAAALADGVVKQADTRGVSLPVFNFLRLIILIKSSSAGLRLLRYQSRRSSVRVRPAAQAAVVQPVRTSRTENTVLGFLCFLYHIQAREKNFLRLFYSYPPEVHNGKIQFPEYNQNR